MMQPKDETFCLDMISQVTVAQNVYEFDGLKR